MTERFLISTLTLLFLPISIQAQIQKGAILFRGNFNFYISEFESEQINSTITSENTGSTTNFIASPGAGLFVSTSDLIGAQLVYDFRFWKTESLSEMRRSEQVFSLGPYYSRYDKIGESLYLVNTLETGIGIGTTKNKEDGTVSSEGELLEIGVAVRTGINYFLNDQFAISAGIGVLSYEWKESKSKNSTSNSENINRSSRFGLSTKFNTFSLGIQYFLHNVDQE
ncbi:MAG: hypothetical protein HKN45_00780 [Flavobacteriales bacterium]|nr:hypothetical protein [Flavobacteriales bacterium]